MSSNPGLLVKQSLILLSLFAVNVHLVYAQIGFTKHTVGEVFEGVHALQAADLDADGQKEIIGASLDAILVWSASDGPESAWVADTISSTFEGARFIDVRDIDKDGDPDLFGAAKGIDTVSWWENQGGQWVEHIVDEAFDFAIHVFAEDLDADGDIDLLGAALKENAITWWENTDGVGASWSRHDIDTNFEGARHVCVVDIDGDSDLDIVGSADLANTIAWWENKGGAPESWEKHVVDSLFTGVNSVFPADLDGDGLQDLLGVADIGDEIAWWRNVPGEVNTWDRITVRSNYDGAISVFPIDMDNDRDLDIVGAAALGDNVAWWENTSGNGLMWQEHLIEEEFDAPSYIIANDIDKDGDVDVLGGTLKDTELIVGDVVWWENESLLPVELSAFDALVDGNQVHLSWRTLTELNNAGFEVQYKSGDRYASQSLSAWSTLAFVEGQGTTIEPVGYSHDAGQYASGLHLFRLRQIDFDGGFDFSKTLQVYVGIGEGLRVTSPYPNPFNPQTSFSVNMPVSQKVSIDVYNSLGQRVSSLYNGILEGEEGHQFEFRADTLPGGMYLIRVIGEQFSEVRQVLLVK